MPEMTPEELFAEIMEPTIEDDENEIRRQIGQSRVDFFYNCATVDHTVRFEL